MSVELLRYPTYLWATLLLALMAWLMVIFILHFFVPKAMLKTYFKEPHFSPAEIEFFTGFPFAYIRTVMFMRLAGWPESGEKRGLTEAYKLAPSWFRVISRILIRFLFVGSALLGILGIFLFVGFYYFENFSS